MDAEGAVEEAVPGQHARGSVPEATLKKCDRVGPGAALVIRAKDNDVAPGREVAEEVEFAAVDEGLGRVEIQGRKLLPASAAIAADGQPEAVRKLCIGVFEGVLEGDEESAARSLARADS